MKIIQSVKVKPKTKIRIRKIEKPKVPVFVKNPVVKLKRAKVPKGINLDLLRSRAISAMALARPRRSGLLVGCAVIDDKNNIFTGANIEILWQRSFHAEETAITGALVHDCGKIRAICIAAERSLFTPCGACMDLILEFSIPDAVIVHINPKTRKTTIIPLSAMMPFYPTRV